ncbi:MAG: hypothetical protein IIB39_08245 [Candidatus Marinimicrobia bacterium]|nr:hypothetical protein [Candidatus Neomarinimicrobiota bacterium]
MEKIHSLVDLMVMGVVLIAAIFLLSQNLIEMDTFIVSMSIIAIGDMIASAIKRVASMDGKAS